MKKASSLALITISLVALCMVNIEFIGASEDSWTPLASMPTARTGLGVAVVNGKIFAIGGHSPSYAVNGINEMYDPTNNTWTTLAPMPLTRAHFAIAAYQNKIYVIGGKIGVTIGGEHGDAFVDLVTGINQVYDPATNTWENRTSMPTARSVLQANVVDDKIYLISGFSQGSHFSNLTEVYDPASDSWTTMAAMPAYQNEFASTVVDNKIYIISDKVQIFDPKTNNWTFGAPPPTSTFQGAASATTGIVAPKRIYVIDGGALGLNQIYHPENNSWTLGESMPTPRHKLAVAVLNDILYTIGGSTDLGVLAINEQYIPFGYGTVILPSPSANPSSTPTPSPSTQTQQTTFPTKPIYELAALAGITIITTVAVLLRRKKAIKPNTA